MPKSLPETTVTAAGIDVDFFATKFTCHRAHGRRGGPIVADQFPSLAPRDKGIDLTLPNIQRLDVARIEVAPGVAHLVGKDRCRASRCCHWAAARNGGPGRTRGLREVRRCRVTGLKGLDNAISCEIVDFMEQANHTPAAAPCSMIDRDNTTPRRRADFGAFRLDGIALNPDLAHGPDSGVPEAAAPESTGAWILEDRASKAIVDQVLLDVRKLGTVGAGLGIHASRYGIVMAMGFAYCEAPKTILGQVAFTCKFVWRAIALSARCQLAYCAAVQTRRRRAIPG